MRIAALVLVLALTPLAEAKEPPAVRLSEALLSAARQAQVGLLLDQELLRELSERKVVWLPSSLKNQAPKDAQARLVALAELAGLEHKHYASAHLVVLRPSPGRASQRLKQEIALAERELKLLHLRRALRAAQKGLRDQGETRSHERQAREEAQARKLRALDRVRKRERRAARVLRERARALDRALAEGRKAARPSGRLKDLSRELGGDLARLREEYARSRAKLRAQEERLAKALRQAKQAKPRKLSRAEAHRLRTLRRQLEEHFLRARKHLRRGALEEATAEIDKLVKLARAGRIEAREARRAMESTWRKALRKHPDVLSSVDLRLSVAEGNRLLMEMQGASNLGRREAALKAFEELKALREAMRKIPHPAARRSAWALYSRAQTLVKKLAKRSR